LDPNLLTEFMTAPLLFGAGGLTRTQPLLGPCLSIVEYATAYKLRIFIFITLFMIYIFICRSLCPAKCFRHFFDAIYLSSFFRSPPFLLACYCSANSVEALNCLNLLISSPFCLALLPLTEFALAY